MRKNPHPFTPAGVLAYITDNCGIRYQCSQIAKVFKVTPAEMRPVLIGLVESGDILGAVGGRYRWFFIKTAEDLAVEQRAKDAQEGRVFRPLVGYDRTLADHVELAMMARR